MLTFNGRYILDVNRHSRGFWKKCTIFRIYESASFYMLYLITNLLYMVHSFLHMDTNPFNTDKNGLSCVVCAAPPIPRRIIHVKQYTVPVFHDLHIKMYFWLPLAPTWHALDVLPLHSRSLILSSTATSMLVLQISKHCYVNKQNGNLDKTLVTITILPFYGRLQFSSRDSFWWGFFLAIAIR